MYQITFRAIAFEEYAEAAKWYSEKSVAAANKFIKVIDEKLDNISLNPLQYKNLHKNFYEVSTRKYPYTIVYFIEEKSKRIAIVSIYHQKRNPKKKYRK